jgi:hypothetical protein
METEDTTPAPTTIWEYVEAAPGFVSAIADLWGWSLNYDHQDPRRPFPLFLDLVGYSEEQYGCRLSTWGRNEQGSFGGAVEGLGWIELDKLAKALLEYTDRPRECDDWITGLMSGDLDE